MVKFFGQFLTLFSNAQGVICLLCLAGLVACGSTPKNRNDGRYHISQDIAPDRLPQAHEMIDPTPIHEPPSRGGNKDYEVLGKHYKVIKNAEGFSENGVASWYGKKFHGHLTSNGETYNMFEMSAAHKTLPLPTYVKVTNLTNQKQAVVRVNDRGPFHQGRIIDLSYAAAYKLGVTKTGTAKVKIEVLHSAPGFYIEIEKGAQQTELNDKSAAIAALFQIPTKIIKKNETFRLIAGPITEQKQAKALVSDLMRSGYPSAKMYLPENTNYGIN